MRATHPSGMPTRCPPLLPPRSPPPPHLNRPLHCDRIQGEHPPAIRGCVLAPGGSLSGQISALLLLLQRAPAARQSHMHMEPERAWMCGLSEAAAAERCTALRREDLLSQLHLEHT